MMTSTPTYFASRALRAAGVLGCPAAKQGSVVARFHEEAKPNTSLDMQRQWITH